MVDEAHVYRGVFGAHVANVLRRLRRVAAAYGTTPRFLLASATIANPVELAERLTGLEDVRARRRGRLAGRAAPDRDVEPAGGRRGAAAARAARWARRPSIVAELVREGARTICFIKSRKAVELVARIVREQARAPELADRVAPYRAGYTPQQRRELEARLTNGDLLAVITTDALELGIDIGALDAAVCVTFPGTVASLRQMWGRAGRRGRGLAVYVAGEDALDQFFCRHPDEFLERPVEAAIVWHENEPIHLAHLLCAAHEGPLDRGRRRDPRPALAGLRATCSSRRASWSSAAASTCCATPRTTRPRACRCARRRPTASRWSTSPAASCSGTVESSRAANTIHDGAVYLHLGRSYEVARARPRRPPRARRALRRQLVHAAQERDRHGDRAPARPPRDARRDAELRPA